MIIEMLIWVIKLPTTVITKQPFQYSLFALVKIYRSTRRLEGAYIKNSKEQFFSKMY